MIRIEFCSLDLDKWIYEPPSESDEDFKSDDFTFMMTSNSTGANDYTSNLNGPSSHRPKKGKKRRGKKGEDDDEDEEMEKVRVK